MQSHSTQRSKVLRRILEDCCCCSIAKIQVTTVSVLSLSETGFMSERGKADCPSLHSVHLNRIIVGFCSIPHRTETQRREELSAKIKTKVCRTSSKAKNKVCQTRVANPGPEEESSRQRSSKARNKVRQRSSEDGENRRSPNETGKPWTVRRRDAWIRGNLWKALTA